MTNPLSVNMIRNALPMLTPDSHLVPNDFERKGTESGRAAAESKGEETPLFGFSHEPNLGDMTEMYQWNYRISREFHGLLHCRKWVLAIVHGYCKHISTHPSITDIRDKGTVFNLIVIARRSRHHAGTRYIKRGIDRYGFVANFVEVEQIVINYSLTQDVRPVCSSFVQVRGSVPTFWMQHPSIAIPKPAIEGTCAWIQCAPMTFST